jgi:hypothetical protein
MRCGSTTTWDGSPKMPGDEDVVQPGTVLLQLNPRQRNGKNLCRPHPTIGESLIHFVGRFQHLGAELEGPAR